MSTQHKPSRLQLAFSAQSSSPAPLSPMAKIAQPTRTASQDSADGIRKRVCKACDRCRLKKSKCDGSSPCSRCKVDNAICVFGERKKSHDKVYPKGYVEMLEQQQGQLVSALQETYKRLVAVDAWSGPVLSETSGHPLTHDILAALHLLESKQDGSGELEMFEEDCTRLQTRLIADGAAMVHRRGSFSSDSEHSHHDPSHSHDSPISSKPPLFRDSFAFNSSASTPSTRSPAHRQKQSVKHPQASAPSPLQQTSPSCGDPLFFHADWSLGSHGDPTTVIRSRYAMQAPALDQGLPSTDFDEMFASGLLDTASAYDVMNGSMPTTVFPQQMSMPYGGLQADYGPGFDQMDVDFNKFLQAVT